MKIAELSDIYTWKRKNEKKEKPEGKQLKHTIFMWDQLSTRTN